MTESQIERPGPSRFTRILKRIAAYAVVGYLSLVGAEALLYAYIGIQYTSHPGWDVERQREKRDEGVKKAFLETHPEYSGLAPEMLFTQGGAFAEHVHKHSFLPLGHGLPRAPLIYCNEGYGFLKYTTDRYGFHNDDAVWDAERPWLLIGDSFAHGACVPSEDNIASRLMKGSKRAVINLGSAGNGPDRYVALARVFIGLTRPSKVVLIFYENDFNVADGSIYATQTDLFAPYFSGDFQKSTRAFYDDLRKLIDAKRSQFLSQEKRWSERFAKVRRKVVSGAERVLTLADIRNVVLHNIESFNYVQLAVETTAQECAKLDPACEVIVVYIPPSQYFRPRPRPFIDAQVADLRDVISKVDGSITFIDLCDKLDRKSYAPEGPHLSIGGYRFVAEQISKHVKAR